MSLPIHSPTSNLSFMSGVSMWIVMSSIGSTVLSQLIRVDRFLIIKDTNCKTVDGIRQPCMNHKISLIVPLSSATIVSIFCIDTWFFITDCLPWVIIFTLRSTNSYMSPSKICFTVCRRFPIYGFNGKDRWSAGVILASLDMQWSSVSALKRLLLF